MSVIRSFRNYLENNHPHLVMEDWKVDVKVISTTDILNEDIRNELPSDISPKITCWKFFYDEDLSNVFYIIQDK